MSEIKEITAKDYESIYMDVINLVEKDNISVNSYSATLNKLKDKYIINLRDHPSPALQDAVKEIAVPSIEHLLDLAAKYGGKIVSTASLNDYEIKQAVASGRMFVNNSYLGYVWIPNEDDIFPETIEAVKQFEEWYPLDEELPDELKTLDWFHKRTATPHSFEEDFNG